MASGSVDLCLASGWVRLRAALGFRAWRAPGGFGGRAARSGSLASAGLLLPGCEEAESKGGWARSVPRSCGTEGSEASMRGAEGSQLRAGVGEWVRWTELGGATRSPSSFMRA